MSTQKSMTTVWENWLDALGTSEWSLCQGLNAVAVLTEAMLQDASKNGMREPELAGLESQIDSALSAFVQLQELLLKKTELFMSTVQQNAAGFKVDFEPDRERRNALMKAVLNLKLALLLVHHDWSRVHRRIHSLSEYYARKEQMLEYKSPPASVASVPWISKRIRVTNANQSN
ncbi:hypothetical protein [Alicyclobacillus mengziensis]|uniref:Uncharacterized protein n=1 Tax=Alicyclobacillus mengziensis TaxID=2931921 RepID=A0A9X7Z570_9BACL|nr:hypothetical protein [Alicyclobacillus mengziensis]QSO46639.1 hypothetical protein JZ786_19640 [Alicyclobacillus mengziensis]